jgi:hypothetical protein
MAVLFLKLSRLELDCGVILLHWLVFWLGII